MLPLFDVYILGGQLAYTYSLHHELKLCHPNTPLGEVELHDLKIQIMPAEFVLVWYHKWNEVALIQDARLAIMIVHSDSIPPYLYVKRIHRS